ncbi:bifunctional riboflavin kinase/FAD synthetase [Stieleria sp. TO1_6]|uniref:bifunctional riboflavin kinase/FAD synthetase n=1 Tax=Stieleria tagensis TaxID=2956795 RepID=UPI00209AAB27|nr:bifunctional riboflavin kinase/FAD synthetase [Stieleria tagensis]MCO8123811.1 bifunctional riboflavin kinase/FAD synthetase [Stieleria tagensis]
MTEIVSLPDVSIASLGAAPHEGLHGGVASIGNFDGVHRGHTSLLKQTRRLADKLSGPAIACLFDPHPIAILRPDAAPKRLTSVAERARRMKPFGIDYLVVCRTSRDLLGLSAHEFFDALIRDNLKCRGMVEGENFCFGKGRGGDVQLLRTLCAEHQIEFEIAEMASAAGQSISSTRIRDLLAAGEVAAAAQMMATPHRISGVVVHGDARGRTIGFPTANLEQIDVVIPGAGVYAGHAIIKEQSYQAAIHIGKSPTFQSGLANKVEVHLLDFSADLYGQTLTVEFIDQIRGIIRFESADALTTQLHKDLQSVRQLLDQEPKT